MPYVNVLDLNVFQWPAQKPWVQWLQNEIDSLCSGLKAFLYITVSL